MSNQPRFEVYVARRRRSEIGPPGATFSGPVVTEYRWRLRRESGPNVAMGGRGFTRREDAHRSIMGAGLDAIVALTDLTREEAYESLLAEPPIVDLDENGDVVA